MTATIVKLGPATGSATTETIRSPSAPRSATTYFGWLPAELTRAVPESLINTIASMVCHAHRKGRKEAYNFLKQFVLKQMRVLDLPHYHERLAENDSSSATTYAGHLTVASVHREGLSGDRRLTSTLML